MPRLKLPFSPPTATECKAFDAILMTMKAELDKAGIGADVINQMYLAYGFRAIASAHGCDTARQLSDQLFEEITAARVRAS